jgi:hypothetical protein
MKSRLLQVLASLTAVAFFLCGQQALAQNAQTPHPNYRIHFAPRGIEAGFEGEQLTPVTKNLYGLTQAFTATDFPTTNTDGTDIWPCFGGGTATNPDCPKIGSPSIAFPVGGVALGVPEYVWSLAKCNATSTSSPVCGETETFYEDDSGDSGDQLTYIVTATQGTGTSLKYVYDSGLVVFGPNTFGNLTPPADVVVFGPSNLGNMGQIGGANNGNCFADFNYPLTAPAFPGVYVIAAGKVCSPAVSGLVNFTAVTEVATPAYHKQTTAAACTPIINGKPGTPVGPPCYTTTFTKKFLVTQKWSIWLQ